MTFNIRYQSQHVADSVFRADRTTILGDVRIGEESSIWFGTVIRGDTERIEIGSKTNIQDLCVLHADPGFPCQIGDRVTVGHGAIVHGAVVENDVMVGMRAVVLNGARLGTGSVIAAGAVVTEGMEIPAGSFVAGVPAKIRGKATQRHAEMIRHAAQHYVTAAAAYRDDDG